MEKLRLEIEKTLKELDDENIDFDYETELLEKLPKLIIKEAKQSIKEINTVLFEGLTEKQKTFYLDIHSYLNEWVNKNSEIFLNLSYEDQLLPGKEAIKITIKRIKELLTIKYDKKTFSNLVDEFKFIKAGNKFEYDGKYARLRNDFN